MKQLLFLVFLLNSLSIFAQEPAYTPMRLNYQFRGIKVDSLFLVPSYTDTTQANGYSAKNIPGSLIRTGSDFWMRNGTATAWLQNVNVGPGSSPVVQFVDSVWRVSGKDSIFWRKGGVTNRIKDSTAGNINLQQVTDNGNTTTNNVGIGITPVYKLDVNGDVRIKSSDSGNVFKITDSINIDLLTVNNDGSCVIGRNGTTTFPLTIVGNSGVQAIIGNTNFAAPENIYRYGLGKMNFFATNNNGIAFDYSFNNSQESSSASSSMVNLGGIYNNQQSFAFSNLLISPVYNFNSNTTTSAIGRGIYYNPTLTNLRLAKHIAFENTSGDIIHKNIKASNNKNIVIIDTAGKLLNDSILTIVDDTLKINSNKRVKLGQLATANKTGDILYNYAKSAANTNAGNFTAEIPGVYTIANASSGNNFVLPDAALFPGQMVIVVNEDGVDASGLSSSGGSIYDRGNSTTLTSLPATDMGTFFSNGINWYGYIQ